MKAGGSTMLMAVALVWAAALPCFAGWSFDGRGATPAGGGSSGGSTSVVVTVCEEDTFPVLRLEVGGHWTDFELKASTNNFTNLVYYIMSSGTNAYTTDTNVWVYFTDDYGADVRQWHRSAPATAISGQVADPSHSEVEFVVVCPSHDCAVDWEAWMARTNNALVWSFVRYDGIGLEMNATGTRTHWNPVVPVEWRKGRIAP